MREALVAFVSGEDRIYGNALLGYRIYQLENENAIYRRNRLLVGSSLEGKFFGEYLLPMALTTATTFYLTFYYGLLQHIKASSITRFVNSTMKSSHLSKSSSLL